MQSYQQAAVTARRATRCISNCSVSRRDAAGVVRSCLSDLENLIRSWDGYAYLLGSAARAEVANGRERDRAAVSCAMR